MSEHTDALIAEPISADEAAELAAAFGSIGLTADSRAARIARSSGAAGVADGDQDLVQPEAPGLLDVAAKTTRAARATGLLPCNA